MKAIAGLSEQDRDLASAPVFCFVSEEQCSVTAGCSPLQSSGSNWPELALACEQQRRPRRRCRRKALAKQEFERALVACVWRRGGLV